jgi:hypothetical protein
MYTEHGMALANKEFEKIPMMEQVDDAVQKEVLQSTNDAQKHSQTILG